MHTLLTTTIAVASPSSPSELGGIVPPVSDTPSRRNVSPPEDGQDVWTRNESIRTAELRADSARPMGELLEAGVELSRFASELAVSAHAGP